MDAVFRNIGIIVCGLGGGQDFCAADQQVTMSVRWDLVFDKTVFLTRKDAEAALKGVKNGCCKIY